MGFKKIRHDGTEEIVEVQVKGATGVQDKWMVMLSDFPSVAKIICNKYGLEIYYKEKISVKKEDNDLAWAGL